MDPVQRFVDHFWAGTDDSLKEYVRGALEELLSQSDAVTVDITDLCDFLPPGQDPSRLSAAAQELHRVVTADGTTGPYEWLKEGATAPEDALNPAPTSFSVSQTMKHSDLKVTAVEFRPVAAPASAAAVSSAAEPLDAALEGLDLGFGEEEGEWEDYDEYSSWEEPAAAPAAAPLPRPLRPPPGFATPAAAGSSEDADLAVLQRAFPGYSAFDLRDMYGRSGCSLPAAMDTLWRLESEIQGFNAARPYVPAAPKPKKPAQPAFSADDFPSLGGGGGGSFGDVEKKGPPTSAPGPVFGAANYAGRAKAAAHLPAPRPSKPAAPRPSAAPAPAWEAAGEVERFSTGTEVAAAYAERRAEARDHARLRNMLFQQATQAYVAGNRALAKELGAKGRWHNEKMKEAHAAAAADTFAQRNAAALGGAGGASVSSSSGGGGVPTIDLHGLHVSEAVDQLGEALERFERRGGVGKVRVVVGLGQHGKVPARLPAAVREALEEWGYSYREPFAGLLEVSLS